MEMSRNTELFKGIHTPAQAWRYAASALRNTEKDMREYDPTDPYTRGMADAAGASAEVMEHMADEYDKWLGV